PRSAACSAVARPSGPCPASRTACTTQFRMALAEGSNLRASSSGDCPPRTSSTSRRRNSAEYGPRVLGMVTSFPPQRIGVHQTGATPEQRGTHVVLLTHLRHRLPLQQDLPQDRHLVRRAVLPISPCSPCPHGSPSSCQR